MGETPADVTPERVRAAEAAHAAHRQIVATAFAPLVALGTEILKAVLVINGGAAVATLWFLATVLHDRPALALPLVLPLASFGFGFTVAGCATGWSYFSHEQHAEALASQERIWSEPFIRDTDASIAKARGGRRYRRAALAAVFVSIASAIVGFVAAGIIMVVKLS